MEAVAVVMVTLVFDRVTVGVAAATTSWNATAAASVVVVVVVVVVTASTMEATGGVGRIFWESHT